MHLWRLKVIILIFVSDNFIVWCVFSPEMFVSRFWSTRPIVLSLLFNIYQIVLFVCLNFFRYFFEFAIQLLFNLRHLVIVLFRNLWVITSISLLICDGSVNSLPKFLSKMLTFSETSHYYDRSLLPKHFRLCLMTEILLSLTVYFSCFPWWKWCCVWKSLNYKDIWVKWNCRSYLYRTRELQKFGDLWVVLEMSDCLVQEIFVECLYGKLILRFLLKWFHWVLFFVAWPPILSKSS